jgi:hypothetical protein
MKSLWTRAQKAAELHADLAALAVALVGIAYRFRIAAESYLNPDEAFLSQLSRAPDFAALFNNAIINQHPPLILFVTRLMQQFSYSEIVLRTPSVLAGGVAPLFAYLWLRRVRGKAAGFSALVILTAAPNLVMLTSQIRGYNLAFLFMAAGLYTLHRGLEEDSVKWMAVFSLGCLYPGILSEYLFVVFCAAAGIYVLLRWGDGSWSARAKVAWTAGQAGALAMLALLQSLRTGSSAEGAPTGAVVDYLRGMYPYEGEGMVAFLYTRTNGLFDYLAASLVTGSVFFVLFPVGIVLLWAGRPRGPAPRPREAVLLVLPFVITAAAAIAEIYPYGGCRQTVHLSLFGALGVAVALDAVFRRRMILAGTAAAVLAPLWVLAGPTDPLNADRLSQKKVDFHAALAFLREEAEAGAVILTEKESRLVLSHYLDSQAPWPRRISPDLNAEDVAGYTLYAPSGHFHSLEQIRSEVGGLKRRYSLGPEDRVWVFDAGFQCYTRHHLVQNPSVEERLPVSRVFGPGIVLLRTYSGFESGG